MSSVIGSNAAIRTKTRKRWTPESGEVEEREYRGPADQVEATYEGTKALAVSGDQRFAGLDQEVANGRAVLIVRYGREGGSGGDVPMGSGANTSTIEELYAVDVLKDVRQHPKFFVGGDWELGTTEADAATALHAVNTAVRNGDSEDNAWTDSQKRLYRMLQYGMDSVVETGFILRRTIYGARNRRVQATFTNTNKVGAVQRLSVSMRNLLDSLPTGEWLKKPSQCEYLGKGQWRVSEEYHWAEKWHAAYGGSLDWGP